MAVIPNTFFSVSTFCKTAQVFQVPDPLIIGQYYLALSPLFLPHPFPKIYSRPIALWLHHNTFQYKILLALCSAFTRVKKGRFSSTEIYHLVGYTTSNLPGSHAFDKWRRAGVTGGKSRTDACHWPEKQILFCEWSFFTGFKTPLELWWFHDCWGLTIICSQASRSWPRGTVIPHSALSRRFRRCLNILIGFSKWPPM